MCNINIFIQIPVMFNYNTIFARRISFFKKCNFSSIIPEIFLAVFITKCNHVFLYLISVSTFYIQFLTSDWIKIILLLFFAFVNCYYVLFFSFYNVALCQTLLKEHVKITINKSICLILASPVYKCCFLKYS